VISRPAVRPRGAVGQLLALATVLIALAWVLPGRPVPIYDGLGVPDQPYRYVNPPNARAAVNPSAVARRVPVHHGVASVVRLKTSEQGPQAEVDILDASLRVHARGPSPLPSTVMVRLEPLAPDKPRSGSPAVDGNVYRLTWTAGSAALTYANRGHDLISLRAPTPPPPPAYFVYRPAAGQPWRPLTTDHTGVDVYSAALHGAGDYALTRTQFQPSPSRAAEAEAPPPSNARVPVVALVLLLALMAAVMIAIRIGRGGAT
jgi:hypothetical protein